MILADFKVGDVQTLPIHGKTFRLKRIRPNVWHLSDLEIRERSRFGDRKQIEEDLAYVLEYGVLPPPSGLRW